MLDVRLEPSGLARVTLARPERANAFEEALIAALAEAFARLPGKGARAILLAGEGRHFSAGADLDWMRRAAGWSEEANRADAQALSDMLAAVDGCPLPVIALVRGSAIGGGAGLVACADLAVADPGARFAFTEVRLGLTPATISPFVLRAIGARQARRWFLTAETFDAATALELGLVHAIDPEAEALALRWADRLLAHPPGALADAKQLVSEVGGRRIDGALRADTAARIAHRRTTAEARERIARFLEGKGA